MNFIFMNSENSKISDSYRPLFDLSDNIDLKISNKYVTLSNLSTYYTQKKKMKKSYKNNKFKISAPTWHKRFELPDWSNVRYSRLF